jgi:hypothetical protein
MKKDFLLVCLLCTIITVVLSAQVPNVGPNDSFAWNQDATNLAAAQGFVYKYYLDGAVTGSVWAGVTCTGTAAPFTCQAKTPAFSQGQHSLTITAANATGESGHSTPFGFVYGNPPSIPNNIRIIKG